MYAFESFTPNLGLQGLQKCEVTQLTQKLDTVDDSVEPSVQSGPGGDQKKNRGQLIGVLYLKRYPLCCTNCLGQLLEVCKAVVKPGENGLYGWSKPNLFNP
jgi:hypothetical protein